VSVLAIRVPGSADALLERQHFCAECRRVILCCHPDGSVPRFSSDRRGCGHLPLSLRSHPLTTAKVEALLRSDLLQYVEVTCLAV
jgi:hypothetical protein